MALRIVSPKSHRLNDGKEGKTDPKKQKRPNPVLRLLAFLITAAMVLGAVYLILNYDKLNFDAVKRWFAYRDLERGENGQAESFPYDGDSSSVFAGLDGDLLVCSSTGIRLYSASGQVYVDRTLVMENPVAVAAGDTALAYDAGGRSLVVCRDRAEAFSLELPEGESILSADINSRGWMVVVTRVSGYKGIATVYDESFSPRVQISVSERFVMDAALSPDSQTVALVTMGLEDGVFSSRAEFYPTSGTSADGLNPQASTALGNQVILELTWDSSGLWALGEDSLCRLDDAGTLTGSFSYDERYLKGFSLEGDGTAVLLLGKYRAGSTAELSVVDDQGAVKAALSLDRQVLSVSAAGRYVAVLTADRLDIYDQDLELYHTLEGTQSARSALMRDDGSVLLIGSSTARVYLPQS